MATQHSDVTALHHQMAGDTGKNDRTIVWPKGQHQPKQHTTVIVPLSTVTRFGG
ncbi:MAG: hypothetical protein KBF97_02210 [Bacteroidetes bacterium]|nr:hypothetical protein [Bacteroidota bacterium]